MQNITFDVQQVLSVAHRDQNTNGTKHLTRDHDAVMAKRETKADPGARAYLTNRVQWVLKRRTRSTSLPAGFI